MADALPPTDPESLLPCPFCGGSVELELCNDMHGKPGFHIECGHCHFALFQRPLHGGDLNAQQGLRKRWNTRSSGGAFGECICPTCGIRHGTTSKDGGF